MTADRDTGRCRECRQDFTLNQDGTLREHETGSRERGENPFTTPGRVCPGSNKPPDEESTSDPLRSLLWPRP